jgi:NTP pyrophosphatase (non-canonical NTP hydrolase)
MNRTTETILSRAQRDRLIQLVMHACPKRTASEHLDKAVEEMAECIEAIMKYKAGRKSAIHVAEEAADVMILAEFLRQCIWPDQAMSTELFDNIMKKKLDRLQRRVETGDFKAA